MSIALIIEKRAVCVGEYYTTQGGETPTVVPPAHIYLSADAGSRSAPYARQQRRARRNVNASGGAMLNDLRQQVADLLGAARQITLTTWGPAELQAALVRCEARDLQLYILVPHASDLLFNLEHRPDVLTVTPLWQVRGLARVLTTAEHPTDLALLAAPEAAWCALVAITPTRLHRFGEGGTDTDETIDLPASQ